MFVLLGFGLVVGFAPVLLILKTWRKKKQKKVQHTGYEMSLLRCVFYDVPDFNKGALY